MDAEGMTGSGERGPSDLARRGPGLGPMWRNARATWYSYENGYHIGMKAPTTAMGIPQLMVSVVASRKKLTRPGEW